MTTTPPIDAPPTPGTVDDLIDADGLDDLPTYTQPEARNRPRWRPIAAAGGAVGIIVGGSFAYAAFNGPDGASSPEAAVEAFVGAISDEDAIGALESLPPSERSALVDTARDLATEAERVGLTAGLDISDVGGFEFEIDGLTLRSEPLGEGVTAVHLDGTLVSQTTGAELPLGDVVLDAITDDGLADFESGVADLSQVFAEEDVFVVAVEEDGGWHTSTWYTIAEYLRRSQDKPVPAFGASPVQPAGAESPEQAVRQYYDAVTDLDLAAALALMDPDEGRVLYDYGPLFFDDVRQDEYSGRTTIERLDLATTGDGATRVVSLTGVASTTTYPEGGVLRTEMDAECYRAVGTPAPGVEDGELFEDTVCRADAEADGAAPWEWDAMVGADFVTVQQDGRWFLSPARSAGATIVESARSVPGGAFDREMLERGAPFGILTRVLNLLGGTGSTGLMGPIYSGTASESCYSYTDVDGTTTTECPAASVGEELCYLEVDEQGNEATICETVGFEVDPLTGEPFPTATTMVAEVTPDDGIVDTGDIEDGTTILDISDSPPATAVPFTAVPETTVPPTTDPSADG